ncbi:MAG TPA: FecR domain-containing protein [Candidatus Limnocylindria bacterium]|nr:FecR domain-containing protein [Candidatus Limnocylindria bacterium]
MKKLLVLLIVVGAIAAFLYYPRGSGVSAADAATLAILNTAIEGSRGGGTFGPALDGEIFKTGDLVRANVEGRAVLTFFDASTLSVDPGSQVKVLALNKVSGDGMQVTLEQSLGRSWSSVQKLKTPDSRYEMRTPSTTAVVRGTAFITLVQPLPAGGTQTTYQVDEGTLQVTATAGGTVTVPAGTQVTIADGATAPASPTPIAPSPRLEITGTPGLGFLVVAPTGAACGPTGSKAEIFGCVATANKVTVRDPAAGRWGLFLTSASPLTAATVTVEGFVGTTRGPVRAVSRTYAAGDLVRSGISLTAGPQLVLSPFEELTLVTSVCAATAPGRVFASGPLESRLESVRAFSRESKNSPVSVVYTAAELNQAANASAPTPQGVKLSDTKVTIDGAGIHGTAKAETQFITVNASADVVGGPVGDKFTLRVSRLSADPLPPGLVDAVRGLVDTSTADLSSTIPFLVKQVAFRNGCFWVSGVTQP